MGDPTATNDTGDGRGRPSALPPCEWSEDAAAGLVLLTAALDLIERAGTYDRATRPRTDSRRSRRGPWSAPRSGDMLGR